MLRPYDELTTLAQCVTSRSIFQRIDPEIARRMANLVMMLDGKKRNGGPAFVCGSCGGTRIERVCWVKPNTDEVVEPFGDWDESSFGYTWCHDCEEHTRIIKLASATYDPPPLTVETALRELLGFVAAHTGNGCQTVAESMARDRLADDRERQRYVDRVRELLGEKTSTTVRAA